MTSVMTEVLFEHLFKLVYYDVCLPKLFHIWSRNEKNSYVHIVHQFILNRFGTSSKNGEEFICLNRTSVYDVFDAELQLLI